MKPDVVMQYCVYNDYPIFRNFLNKHRNRFNKVIIYPSRHHGFIDFEDFSKQQVKETWVEPVSIDYGTQDWRQAETEPCLEHLESDWVWFMEQDFFVTNWDKFFDDLDKKEFDVAGFWHHSRFPYLHPCSLLMRREVFEKTKKDFRAHPDIIGCDHFAMLTRDAEEQGVKILKYQDMGYVEWEDMMHLGGLTYPYQNWSKDRIFGVGNLDAFYTYNEMSREAQVYQDKRYEDLSYEIEDYLNRHKDISGDRNKWKVFYDNSNNG